MGKMMKCGECIHERVCDIWREQEHLDASCFCNDCFDSKYEKWSDARVELPGLEMEKNRKYLTVDKHGIVSAMEFSREGFCFTFEDDYGNEYKAYDIRYWAPILSTPMEGTNNA